ncbi:MAG: family 78 glycoside hydrolase catalytic domain [Bacteroidaceae bacterium]|nr:family 78 glycoside hydrolase catalytic domain [Bacteroidaceae bacterium]
MMLKHFFCIATFILACCLNLFAQPTQPIDWEAQWIASDVMDAVPYFARDFIAKKRVKKATLRASALGVMTLRLNGQPVSENRLEPGESQWDQTVLYCTYDVTPLMKRGKNRLQTKVGGGLFSITPAPGRYTKPEIKNNGTSAFLCQLDIEYKDGNTERIVTDDSWLTAPSPTLLSNWWGGEDYDARCEPKPDDWHAVKCIQPTTNLPIEEFIANPQHQRPIGGLHPQEHEPVRVVEEWQAARIFPLKNGDYIVDFGQNFAGVFEFTLKGKTGQKLRLQTSEQLNADGTVNAQDCYCGPIVVYDTYTFGHDGVETWAPELMYHGFRYLQVSGLTSMPKPSQFKALRMRMACDAVGHFETSDTLINQIHYICRNSIESQLFHVFTDCPQREKMGWLDVPNQMFGSIALNFDFRRLCHKIVRDCFDAQAYYEGAKRGKVPSTVPHFFTDWDDDPNWGGSAILLPYRTWKTYGDHSLISEHYEGMKRLIDYYTALTTDGLMPGASYSRLSDWGQESSGLQYTTAPEFTITCTYYYLLKAMAEMAQETGRAADAQHWEQQAEETRVAFNARFYNDSTATYAHGNQAELAIPLYYGLTDKGQEQRVADRLAEKVAADGYKVKTGECGLKPVLMVLAQYGHNDIVWQMACQTDYPSYGYFVKNGCTTTPELWDMRYSQNHCMLDHIEEWFYTHLAGIQNVGTAYNHIRLQPYVPDSLDSLSASVKTPHGSVASEFHRQTDGSIRYHFDVPKDCIATILLPDGSSWEVESGSYDFQSSGIGNEKCPHRQSFNKSF